MTYYAIIIIILGIILSLLCFAIYRTRDVTLTKFGKKKKP